MVTSLVCGSDDTFGPTAFEELYFGVTTTIIRQLTQSTSCTQRAEDEIKIHVKASG
jgi:hypothetical protein